MIKKLTIAVLSAALFFGAGTLGAFAMADKSCTRMPGPIKIPKHPPIPYMPRMPGPIKIPKHPPIPYMPRIPHLEKIADPEFNQAKKDVENNNIDAVKAFIEKPGNIYKKGILGETLLHCAAQYGSVEIATLLIQHGADVNEKDNDGKTPLHFAVIHSRVGIIITLIQHGAKM